MTITGQRVKLFLQLDNKQLRWEEFLPSGFFCFNGSIVVLSFCCGSDPVGVAVILLSVCWQTNLLEDMLSLSMHIWKANGAGIFSVHVYLCVSGDVQEANACISYDIGLAFEPTREVRFYSPVSPPHSALHQAAAFSVYMLSNLMNNLNLLNLVEVQTSLILQLITMLAVCCTFSPR